MFRDATVFEQELFLVFALEARLTDGLFEVLLEGVQPWWQRTREAAGKDREVGEIEFGEPPDGFSADGGWWESVSGVVAAIPVQAHASDDRVECEKGGRSGGDCTAERCDLDQLLGVRRPCGTAVARHSTGLL
jgi:hypothetical protein